MARLTAIAKRTGVFALSLVWSGTIQCETVACWGQDYGGAGQGQSQVPADPAAQNTGGTQDSGSANGSAGDASAGSTGSAESAGSSSSNADGSEMAPSSAQSPEMPADAESSQSVAAPDQPAAEAPQPGEAQSGPQPIPNQEAIADTTRTFGASEIPGYTEAMSAAKDPVQAKGNKQLIESLRDVFPINGNPLKDLFTPQPQYVTPQTLMNPQPSMPKPGEVNPLKGLFTPQPQYITPQTLMNPEPSPPAGEINHLKGVFTAQPQYITPQTIMNPHALPRYYVKERLPDHFFVKDDPGKKTEEEKAETPQGPSRAADNAGSASTHPLRQAMLLINSGHEFDAIGLMDRVLVQYPGNFQAHYVKAVALVRLRRFGDARDEYKTILQFSSEPGLKKLAQEGLTKLDE